MKRSEAIFFGVLALAVIVLVACVQPGEAVKRPAAKPIAAPQESAISRPLVPACSLVGGYCGPSGNRTQICCGGLNCVNNTCVTPTPPCSQVGQLCGLNQTCCGSLSCSSAGICINPPPPQNCSVTYRCRTNFTSTFTNSSCQTSTTNCPCGCNGANGQCNPTCTPTTQCINNTFVQTNSCCATTSTNCGLTNQTCTPTGCQTPSCAGVNQSCTSTSCCTGLNCINSTCR